MKYHESMSKALGIIFEPEKNLPTKTQEENIPDVIMQVEQQKDQVEDYNLSRKTFTNLIKKGNEAIDDLYELAKSSESARSYEVLATLMKTVADTTDQLYDLQKKTKDLKEIRGKPTQPEGAVSVEKAVFIGTTADLLKQVKEGSK